MDNIMAKVYRMLIFIMATIAAASCACEFHCLSNCNYQVYCKETISVSLPANCRGSTNDIASVDLTITEAKERFDEADTEFLTSITSLKVSGYWPKTNLSLLEYTPRLERILLVGDYIETIYNRPFYNLTHLEVVDLSKNRLKEISKLFQFENGPNSLKYLFLAYNEIENIPAYTFAELSSLIDLDLSYNFISSLHDKPFTSLKSLKTLKLNNNRIYDLNGAVNSLHNLKHLFLSGNEINHINGSSLKIIYELETFDISHNQLQSLTSVVLTRHWSHFAHNFTCKINLSNNFITSLPNSTLSKLILHRYKTQTRRYLNTVNVLTDLDLSQNRISSVAYNAFEPVLRLSVLDLSQNNLSSFHVNASDLEHVKYLNLRNNYFLDFNFDHFSSVKSLQHLDLSYNRLENIPVFTETDYESSLKYVDLSNNQIKTIESLGIAKKFGKTGGVLNLSNNGLYKLKIPNNEGMYLETLILNHNNISDLSLVRLYFQVNLRHLEMINNSITELNENAIQLPGSIIHLDLTSNRIVKVAPASFSHMKDLKTLQLQYNTISEIEYGAFQGLHSLTYLDVSYNNIRYLDFKVLLDLKNLKELSLEFNNMFLLDYKDCLGQDFDLKVYLEGNNFTCEWLGTAISDFNNGYSSLEPLAIRKSTTGPSLNGISCVKKEIGELLEESSRSVAMGDQRLLVLVQKILGEVRYQTSLIGPPQYTSVKG